MKLSFFDNLKVEILFLIFIVIQPFLNIYITFIKNPFEIFGFSINVLINFIFIFIFFIYYIRKIYLNIHKKKYKDLLKKDFIIYLIFIIVFLIYCVLHYYNMTRFDENIFNRNSFGFIKESYFIFRCYCLPLILLITMYRLNIKKKHLIFIVKISVFIICFIVVFTNIFKVSLAAYAEWGKLIYIKGNIFYWPFFNGKDNFDLFTSKGWFHSANELSAILLSLSPIIFYSTFIDYVNLKKGERIFNYVTLLLLIITMNMLGTRTAIFGIFAIFMCFAAIYLFFIFKNKSKVNWKNITRFCLFLLICISLFLCSPFYNKRYGKFKTEFKQRPLKKEEQSRIVKIDDNDFSKFVKNHCWNYYIEPTLIDIYPVENDKEFWYYLINRDLRLNSNYRIMKTDFYNRILERNNNKLDRILGLGYNDILDNEKDYSLQIYHFGILGLLIFVGPYIYLIIYAIYKIIFKSNNYLSFLNVVVLMGNCIGLSVPYLTGHVFGITFPMVYIVLNSLLLLICFKGSENNG